MIYLKKIHFNIMENYLEKLKFMKEFLIKLLKS